MADLSFDDYAYHARSTAYFLENSDQNEQFKTVYYGFNEELTELLTDETYPKELTAQLWGREIQPDIALKLTEDKISEAGDVLYYIVAAGILRNVPLRYMAEEAIERYTNHSAIACDESFQQFDEMLNGHMSASVDVDYRPDYRTWKLWDFAPFVDTLHIVLREPTHAKGPLQIIGDGRYALERLHSTFARFMNQETGTDEEFIASAGLALGGLSIVLQHRFNSTLQEAAENNIIKRERRVLSNTIQAGSDTERSRPADQVRPKLSPEESTRINLVEAPIPEL